jgi:hypothetical protein
MSFNIAMDRAMRKRAHDAYMAHPFWRQVLKREAIERHGKYLWRLYHAGVLTPEVQRDHFLHIEWYFEYDGWRE